MLDLLQKIKDKPSLLLWLLVPFFLAFLIVGILKSNLLSSAQNSSNQTQQASNAIDVQVSSIEVQVNAIQQQVNQNKQDIQEIEKQINFIEKNGVSENWHKNQ
jgi:peptidoglycan hydrolase CwlO-like protein